MILDRTITVAKKGVTVTLTFTQGDTTRRTMKIASSFVSKLLDQFINKLDSLDCGYWLETASPQKDEVVKICEEDTHI